MKSIVRDETASRDGLAIIEKYESFVSYVYQCTENCPHQHRAFRDVLVGVLLAPIGGLYHAAKSRQVSRLHAVDADFATLRSLLRFAAHVRVISLKQHSHALALLAEPGKMLGAWMRKLNDKRSSGASASEGFHHSTSDRPDGVSQNSTSGRPDVDNGHAG